MSLVTYLYPEGRAILRLHQDRLSFPRLQKHQRHSPSEREDFWTQFLGGEILSYITTYTRWAIRESIFIVVQSLSHIWLFVTPWTAACQASLSFTIFQSLLKLMSVESVMPSNHLVLCRPLILLPSIFPGIRVFSNELALCIRWPKYGYDHCDINIITSNSGSK